MPLPVGRELGLIRSDGYLQCGKDAHGNHVPDFAEVGYDRGIVPLPYTTSGVTVSTRVTLSPTSGDQTARIQAAIDQVSQLPLDANSYRGAVYLLMSATSGGRPACCRGPAA